MKTKDFKERFKLAWQNPRQKAAIKLGLYLLFIIGVCILLGIGSSLKNNDIPPQEKELTYEEKINKLALANFGYRYTIKSNDLLVATYTGVNLESKTLGYKETNLEMIRYYVNDKTYKVILGNIEEITNLYTDIDENYINITYLTYLLKSLNKTNQYDNQNNLYYEYLNNNDILNVYFDTNNITKITIQTNTLNYDLEYSKIGEITENDLIY